MFTYFKLSTAIPLCDVVVKENRGKGNGSMWSLEQEN